MNRKSFLPLISLFAAITGCARTENSISVAPAPVQTTGLIEQNTTSWGHIVASRQISPAGTVRSWTQNFRTAVHSDELQTQKDPSTYQSVAGLLEHLHRLPPLDCRGAPTDGPSVIYKWRLGGEERVHGIYQGCYVIPRTAAIQAAYDIEHRIDELLRPD